MSPAFGGCERGSRTDGASNKSLDDEAKTASSFGVSSVSCLFFIFGFCPRQYQPFGVSWFQMNTLKITKFILFLAFLLAANNFAYGQIASCKVTTYFREIESGNSSGNFLVGNFLLQPDNDEDTTDETTKFLHHEESDVNVSVGVQISSAYPNKSKGIKAALSFTGKSDDTFELIDGSQAETIYDKHWKLLSVSDDIRVGNRIYTFTLSCERENKRRGR